MIKEISIKYSKIGLLKLILLLLILICLGFLFVFNPSKFVFNLIPYKEIIFILGLLMLLNIILIIPHFQMLFTSNSALVINKNGIINNSNWTNMGLIEWDDIEKIEIITAVGGNHKYISVILKNPDKYISRIKNPIMKLNILQYKLFYSTPIVFNHNMLDCSFEELENTLNIYITKSKNVSLPATSRFPSRGKE